MSIIKECMEYYKNRKREEKAKKRLLSRDMDYNFLEQCVQKVNENPNLKIHIKLNDGTDLDVYTYKRSKVTYGQIDGDEFIQ